MYILNIYIYAYIYIISINVYTPVYMYIHLDNFSSSISLHRRHLSLYLLSFFREFVLQIVQLLLARVFDTPDARLARLFQRQLLLHALVRVLLRV